MWSAANSEQECICNSGYGEFSTSDKDCSAILVCCPANSTWNGVCYCNVNYYSMVVNGGEMCLLQCPENTFSSTSYSCSCFANYSAILVGN